MARSVVLPLAMATTFPFASTVTTEASSLAHVITALSGTPDASRSVAVSRIDSPRDVSATEVREIVRTLLPDPPGPVVSEPPQLDRPNSVAVARSRPTLMRFIVVFYARVVRTLV